MKCILRFVGVFLLLFALHGAGAAQKKDKVELVSKILHQAADKSCRNLKPGRLTNSPKIDYPSDARLSRIGGTVVLTAKIDQKGSLFEVESVSGHKLLQGASMMAARKAKFSPTICDGTATMTAVVLTFSFLPFISADGYHAPAKVEEFTDINPDSPYYESIVSLTENYKIAFGYAPKNFYADAPLTRGDFAHFLRLTLDLLSERARTANKIPREINLFFAYNPQKNVSINNVRDIKPNVPFYESVKTLLLKYDINLVNESGAFQGGSYLTNVEVMNLWSQIFGSEAIPVNFDHSANGDRIMTRGEFALFLQESLQVLTYKVLP